jgi:hypothetical protein
MRYFWLIILLFAGHVLHSQVLLGPNHYDSKKFIDSLRIYADKLAAVYKSKSLRNGLTLLSDKSYDAFFSKWLAYVNFSKDGYPDGNSVLVAPNSASTRLRTTLAYKGNDIVYNAGTEVNFSNNIGNVLSKSDVTANTTFFGSVGILPKLKTSRKIFYDVDRAGQNDSDKIELLDKFMANVQKRYGSDYKDDTAKYNRTLDSVRQAGGFSRAPAPLLVDYYATLEKARSYGFNENAAYYMAMGHKNARIESLKDSIKLVLDSLETANDAIQIFQFSWFNGSFAYTRNDYTTYNGNALFAKRVTDVFFDSLAFNLGFNFLFERTLQRGTRGGSSFLDRSWLRSFYLTANYNVARDINYAHMTATNIFTTQNISDPNNTGPIDTVYQLQSQTKGINITNKPKVTGWAHTFSTKAFVILANSSLMGFDVALSGSYGRLIEPVYSAQVGILFRFADSQTQKTKVNFELFLQLNDWGDSQQSGLSTWQRKVVGINASIPFNKLFF